MQIITPINQKGRVGKITFKRLKKNYKLFFKKRRIFGINVVVVYNNIKSLNYFYNFIIKLIRI
jgi:sulfatase maturation enzyme AslB (radical SAM superfamily)